MGEFGLLGRNRKEPSEFEKKFGVELMGPDRDPYAFNIGKYVDLITSAGTYTGIYAGMSVRGDILLHPFVFRQIRPIGESPYKTNGEMTYSFSLVTERPAVVRDLGVITILPTDSQKLKISIGLEEKVQEAPKE
jgi:hypothetical protein